MEVSDLQQCPLQSTLNTPQRQSGGCEYKKNVLPLPGFEPQITIQLIAQSKYLSSSGTWVFNISKHCFIRYF